MGNVVVAVPKRVTKESLRPYASGGLGLMQPKAEDFLGVFPVDRSLLGMNVGGGVIGFITRRTGVRWDIRRFRTVKGKEDSGAFANASARLSYWRGTMGLVIRY